MFRLIQEINNIFSEEYASENIRTICRTREKRKTFNLNAGNLGMRTDCSARIFELLNCFVMATTEAQEALSPFSRLLTPSMNTGSDFAVGLPSAKDKLNLSDALKEAQDIFLAYAEDTRDSIFEEIKRQVEE